MRGTVDQSSVLQIWKITAIACLMPFAASAQDDASGGVSLNFGIDQRFDANSDTDLSTPEAEDGFTSVTTLRFGLLTETRTERFSADLSTNFRLTEDASEAGDSSLRFAYGRNSADSVLALSARTTRSDIEFLRSVSDFVDADGTLVLPDDFDELAGTGTRLVTSLGASLRWGETDPVGYSIAVNQELLRYTDTSATLLDRTVTSVDAGVRLNINPVTTARINLGFSQTDEDESPLEDRVSLRGGVTFDRPLGDLTGQLGATRIDDGDLLWSASLGRTITLADQSFNGTLGVVEDGERDVLVRGGLGYTRALPTGQIGLSASSEVDSGDAERKTTVQANYSYQLNPLQNWRFSFAFGSIQDGDNNADLSTASLSAAYGIRLTSDVQVNLGVSASMRDDDGVRSDNQSVFITLGRSFTRRP
jgi:hypothetical protein